MQETLDAVETLLKKHEAFERAASTQEERFVALERITSVGRPLRLHTDVEMLILFFIMIRPK